MHSTATPATSRAARRAALRAALRAARRPAQRPSRPQHPFGMRVSLAASGRIYALYFEIMMSASLSPTAYHATAHAIRRLMRDASVTPGPNVDTEIFDTIKEEIELSERRSAAARHRAALRRALSSPAVKTDAESCPATLSPIPDSEAAVRATYGSRTTEGFRQEGTRPVNVMQV